jgi:hypothetical protein
MEVGRTLVLSPSTYNTGMHAWTIDLYHGFGKLQDEGKPRANTRLMGFQENPTNSHRYWLPPAHPDPLPANVYQGSPLYQYSTLPITNYQMASSK